ncbi:hypothetical protein CRENPOLYSF1_190076 [Crenothrix polyspora]|uniref:Uncharacterized protein n=1 Tax=Crenothrix polyspora TaxID=360316 RepID=A0A1R4H593_9GAMM|nr:hypothetical protein CRENPOLYSF1_190076 [Crenothrix polyspora]
MHSAPKKTNKYRKYRTSKNYFNTSALINAVYGVRPLGCLKNLTLKIVY